MGTLKSLNPICLDCRGKGGLHNVKCPSYLDEKRCKKHPKYLGVKQPKVLCEECWAMYLGMSETCKNCGCQENETVRPLHSSSCADEYCFGDCV